MRSLPLLSMGTLIIAGCTEVADLRPPPAPTALPETKVAAEAPIRSRASREQEEFYTRLEEDLLARGLLRSDGGGPDAPFTDDTVARNFLALAFSEEFSETAGLLTATTQSSTLHRWSGDILIEPIFGSTVQPGVARGDLGVITAYAKRLSSISGHGIKTTRSNGNFAVFVLHEQDLSTIGKELRERLPEVSDAEISFVENLPANIYCLVFTSDPANDGEITRAVAVIRAELPQALRTACYHEELAQGLGLANDSDLARPSIFNDDDEYGRLTTHDEHLLSILYDDRLTPGMTETEAAPIVRQTARARVAPAS